MRTIKVRVPATTANLGAGFDCVGLAFDWYDELVLHLDESPGLTIEVTGEGAGQVPLDERHLVADAILKGLAAFGSPRPGMRLVCQGTIPHSRGLGSSAAAIVAGFALAWAVAYPGRPLDLGELTRLGTREEGHPDNVGAAVYGGAILAWSRKEQVSLIELGLPQGFGAIAYVPAEECKTAQARSVLPDMVPRLDAVTQAITAAMLPVALTQRPDLLLEATDDRLHQRYRAALMPTSYELMERLRAAGVPAAISGAGPTVLAVGLPEQLALAGQVPATGFAVHHLAPGTGVHLVN